MKSKDKMKGIEAWEILFGQPADMAQVHRDQLLSTVEPQWRDWFAAVGKGVLPPMVRSRIPPPEYMLPEEWLEGPTPLIYCVCLGRIEWVEHLLARGDSPVACDLWGRPPLYAAIAIGHGLCSKLLLPHGFNLNEPVGVLGDLLLNVALRHDNPPPSRVELMEWLLANGANPSVKNRAGHTTLQCSPVYWELEEKVRNRQNMGKSSTSAWLSVYTSGSCLGNLVAIEMFEKILLLTDISEEALGIRNREFVIELGERKAALVERKEIANELADESAKSGGKRAGRL